MPPRVSRRRRAHEDAQRPYSCKIIKAGSLLAETKAILLHWDKTRSPQANLECVLRQNWLGKSSRARLRHILSVFRQRYLVEPSVLPALVILVQGRLPATALDRILFFHTAQADPLVADVVRHVLLPQAQCGLVEVSVGDLLGPLRAWVAQGRMVRPWSEYTLRRVAQGLLAALRDFGILQGVNKKRLQPAYLPLAAFAYIAYYLHQRHRAVAQLVRRPDWQLFFLTPDAVERAFFAAHQEGYLEYYAAGSVVRLTFPATSLEEYAHVLVERAAQAPGR
ncbi:MAG: DUF1819 family protein [Gemmatales bacterium]|nr:DUF1819 family protein [Gemmatales bacterium]MDW7993069.1 DUF1819 family protein [Gemmatales bacterium]